MNVNKLNFKSSTEQYCLLFEIEIRLQQRYINSPAESFNLFCRFYFILYERYDDKILTGCTVE